MKINELGDVYEDAEKYLDCALGFEDHPKRSWINNAILGRWFLEGVRQVTYEVDKKTRGFINENQRNLGYTHLINDLVHKLRIKVDRFRKKLYEKYHEDRNVMEALTRA